MSHRRDPGTLLRVFGQERLVRRRLQLRVVLRRCVVGLLLADPADVLRFPDGQRIPVKWE